MLAFASDDVQYIIRHVSLGQNSDRDADLVFQDVFSLSILYWVTFWSSFHIPAASANVLLSSTFAKFA